jgi:hypothetical protein
MLWILNQISGRHSEIWIVQQLAQDVGSHGLKIKRRRIPVVNEI